jgi:hypothetical protein
MYEEGMQNDRRSARLNGMSFVEKILIGTFSTLLKVAHNGKDR